MILNLSIDLYNEIKTKQAFELFKILLLVYFLRNVFFIYYFYSNQTLLFKYLIVFQIIIIAAPLLIAYFGTQSKVKLKRPYVEVLSMSKRTRVNSQISLIRFNVPEFLHYLTRTETRVLILLAEGYNYKEICEKMYISRRTVYFHSQNLKEKLNINSTARLRKFAIENRENLPKEKEPALINSMK